MRNFLAVVLTIVAVALAGGVGYYFGRNHPGPSFSSVLVAPPDNDELRRLYEEDQADRSALSPAALKAITDPSVLIKKDSARQDRVKALFIANQLRTGNDFYHAAMIFQHGQAPEDFLLAHEFSVAALIKGKNDPASRLLTAESEDRFLTHVGRSQRFATQFTFEGTHPWKLNPVDSVITDDFRQLMDTQSLAEAKNQEIEMNKAR